MTTRATSTRTHREPAHPPAGEQPLVRRPFHTPVRGHAFARRPPGGVDLARARLVLRREHDNPADPWAVAVWAEGGGVPWRVGYLDRGVAARLGPRLAARAATVPAAFAGWRPSPAGGWRRPLVRVGAAHGDPACRPSVRELPPFRLVTTVADRDPAGGRRRGAHGPALTTRG